MASPTSPMTFIPSQPSPLARTLSPFKNPRPAPSSTSAKTAKLWDEYERVAVENARKRNRMAQTPCLQLSPPSDRGHASHTVRVVDAARPRNSKPRRTHVATPSTTVAICGACKQPITFASGICERCKKTIIMPTSDKQTTTQLSSPTTRETASTSFHLIHNNSSTEDAVMPAPTLPKQQSFCPMPTQLVNPPIRLSSLRPPPLPQELSLEPNRSRKISLTDPNEPFLRLQISKQLAHAPSPYSNPPTPTYNNMPTTPPSTSHSHASTRPSSLANMTPFPIFPYARNNSATPSEFSTLCPYASTTTTSPPSLSRINYALQNTTSAWDDWDSDGEGEKMGLIAWMGRRKDKAKREKGSKASMESFESVGVVGERKKKTTDTRKSREQERLQQARREMVELVRASKAESVAVAMKKKRRPSGFVRVISCGCSRE